MGAALTKKKKKEDVQKKSGEAPPAVVAMQDGRLPIPADPRLPLTTRQKFQISKSWKGVGRAISPTGMNMFLKLFENHGEMLALFEKFRDLRTKDEQADSLELSEHATKVMSTIDEGIRAMDNIDYFLDLLYQIGQSHRKVPGFKKEYFWKIEKPFLESVKLTLGDRYTENMDQIYRVTIQFMLETVIKGYEDAEEKEVNDNEVQCKANGNPSTSTNKSCEISNDTSSVNALIPEKSQSAKCFS